LFLNLKKEMDDSNQELNNEQGSIDIFIRVKPLTTEERDKKEVKWL
jgi:ribosome recycling factor